MIITKGLVKMFGWEYKPENDMWYHPDLKAKMTLTNVASMIFYELRNQRIEEHYKFFTNITRLETLGWEWTEGDPTDYNKRYTLLCKNSEYPNTEFTMNEALAIERIKLEEIKERLMLCNS